MKKKMSEYDQKKEAYVQQAMAERENNQPGDELYLRSTYLPEPDARIRDYYNPNEMKDLYDATLDRATQRTPQVNEHKASLKQRFLDELRENPPHIPNPEEGHPRAFAATLIEETVTPYEQELYADIDAQLEDLPNDYHRDYLAQFPKPTGNELINETKLEAQVYNASGVCSPTEQRETALEALKEHQKERHKINLTLKEAVRLPDGSTFRSYEVSHAEASRSDYPGATHEDHKIAEHLRANKTPNSLNVSLRQRYDYIEKEFSERRGILRKKAIPKDFVERLEKRETERLNDFVSKKYGPQVSPPSGSKGQGQYVASVKTPSSEHHIVQDKVSGRTVILNSNEQRNIEKMKPGTVVELTSKQGPDNRISISVKERQKRVSNDLEL